jgi:hypothetical protein
MRREIVRPLCARRNDGAFRHRGARKFGAIESFEKTPTGVRMNFTKDGHRGIAKATVAVVAVGWMADTSSEHLR